MGSYYLHINRMHVRRYHLQICKMLRVCSSFRLSFLAKDTKCLHFFFFSLKSPLFFFFIFVVCRSRYFRSDLHIKCQNILWIKRTNKRKHLIMNSKSKFNIEFQKKNFSFIVFLYFFFLLLFFAWIAWNSEISMSGQTDLKKIGRREWKPDNYKLGNRH